MAFPLVKVRPTDMILLIYSRYVYTILPLENPWIVERVLLIERDVFVDRYGCDLHYLNVTVRRLPSCLKAD